MGNENLEQNRSLESEREVKRITVEVGLSQDGA